MPAKEKQVIEKQGKEREKCFVIMPISDQGDYPDGHFTKVYEQIFKPAIESAGYEPYRVDENAISDRIIDKIFNAIQECPMAICDLSNRNPNVLYELGLRQAYDKPVVLVQDEKTDRIFDVSGISTVFYQSDRLFENVMEAREKIAKAIIETKEGKKNSIIKIVKAQTAKISTEEVTREDQIEILLSGIRDDLKVLKRDRARERRNSGVSYGSKPYRYNPDRYDWNKTFEPDSEKILSESVEVKWTAGIITLRHGTTNAQIEHEISRAEVVAGAPIFWDRQGDFLHLEMEAVDSEMRKIVFDQLRTRLSDE